MSVSEVSQRVWEFVREMEWRDDDRKDFRELTPRQIEAVYLVVDELGAPASDVVFAVWGLKNGSKMNLAEVATRLGLSYRRATSIYRVSMMLLRDPARLGRLSLAVCCRPEDLAERATELHREVCEADSELRSLRRNNPYPEISERIERCEFSPADLLPG